MSTTEETIEEAFSKFGEVERVKKIKDYCFIHFRTREQAREAMEQMNGNKYFTSVSFTHEKFVVTGNKAG